MAVAIKAENISKAYQLGEIGTGTLSRDLERWISRIQGKEDPFSKIGEANDRTTKGSSDIIWSLKDINFEIEQGDAVGIIGRNGAGKSTLLKILSKVTSPTTGQIIGRGRIASLLEVGTGFHPELTGKENIYLNGAILGMRNKEIKRKFDEIVDFAGVERYIGTPVKRYSSGMYVRLAFAVAAHLDSEILIVDEVLAVGDAEFQKKCLGKMGEVSKGDGRTILFVSHNMASVKQLCNKGIVLQNGMIDYEGLVNGAIKSYKNQSKSFLNIGLMDLIAYKHSDLLITSIKINNTESAQIELLEDQNNIHIEIKGSLNGELQLNIEVRIFTLEGLLISFYSPGHMQSKTVKIDNGPFLFEDEILLPSNLTSGEYNVSVELSHPNIEQYLRIENINLIKHGTVTNSGRQLSYNDIGFFLMEKVV